MKVIDLINMKYNKEEMPKHIVINRMHYRYDNDINTYRDENKNKQIIDFTDNVLNMPVEVIEDEAIDIDSIEEICIRPYKGFVDTCDYLEKKGNELIKAVKQLNKKIKEKENVS